MAGSLYAGGMGYAADSDVYVVQPGDSLWKISLKYQVGLSEIISANPQFKNPNLIYPGDRVTVPLLTAEKGVEAQVVQLVNQERAKHGLKPLKANWELSRVARVKSQDMRDRRYFSHQSPTYGSPFEMMKAFGVSYMAAGENIAAGQTSPQAVMRSWMNSPGHRQNILSPQYTEIGVGYAQGGSYRHYWTQMFIRP
ncbi:SafA/ExsA family spore coat assembly protein [Brevibacillus humidisoli]|uniref:SafA/ExsA family spore coat assembly protein n=1 Tax=Brevibacillus humidisoli TaxID=2895522 RepID=UPI001E4261FD|nr:SafA/ExsA family spore coat assembly protein [Brevibacillus humidisoli]UFJ43184.1 SafA/ExsA family spore coat assembly protein [Brevibacillus humidisoli]